ncbi:DDE-type integrase/transposase/recombinase, partial [Methylomonas koyamae]|uniref:DDE-type integrase/transposase/recombinase n=1 Tax=Methylomonas koyamae TaxID=702114 RepID=UPI000AF99B0E
ISFNRLNAGLQLDDSTKALIAVKSDQVPVTVDPVKPVAVKTLGRAVAVTAESPLILDDKQRERDGSRRLILQFVRSYQGGVAKAVAALNAGYAESTLTPDLMHAVRHCNDKINDDRVGKVSERSISRWRSEENSNGHCIPKKTRVETRWQDVWWLPLFLACYRKPQKPHITEALAEFQKLWAEQGFIEKCPDYYAVRRVIKRVPELVLEWGRSTGSAYRSLQAFIRRDWSNMSSNEVWVGDGHTFKAKVRHPEHGQPFAPEVTVIIDAASRFIVGWAFSLSENQIAVSEALGNAMIKHGKPLIYYSDNGPGQTAKTIDCHSGGMMARLGVDHQTGIPGNPQGRGILEGAWDVTTIAAAKTYATYQGKDMDPDTLKKITNQINSASRKGEVPALVPDWQTFMGDMVARFEEYNTAHRHECLGYKTPAEVYFANFDSTWA